MAVATPEWLSKREGSLRAGAWEGTWLILLAGEPQYRLVPVPADGKFACEVTQTVNGKRLDSRQIYPTIENALCGGLEDLRKALGW